MGELYNPYPKLPKNIRQIGERDQIVKLYVEDYVNTYLKRLYPAGGQDLRVGLLLGNAEEHEGIPYIFIDGALEMEGVACGGEKVEFQEGTWKKAYQEIEQMFPKRMVQGWFLCGAPGSQLSPLNYWQLHSRYFSGANKLMYLNSGMENEEAVYAASEDGFYKLRGYNIYYERNQMMQDYMVARREARRVDAQVDNKVIHNFRRKMESRQAEAAAQKSMVGLLGTLCSVLAVTVLAGGVAMFNNYTKMKEMEHVIASVLPADISLEGLTEEKPEVIIEDGSRTSQVVKETMSAEEAKDPENSLAAPDDQSGAAGQEEAASQEGTVGQGENASQEETVSQGEAASQKEAGSQPESEGISEENSQGAAETETPAGGAETEASALESASPENIYEVQEGETLYSICMDRYHSLEPIDEICRLNGLDDKNRIKIGQELILP